MDAWLDHFLTENNLSYLLNPTSVSTPEQLRFMVALEENQIYLPCSDEMFRLLRDDGFPAELKESYRSVYDFVEALAKESDVESYVRERVLIFLQHRFRVAEDEHILIPARLLKRLLSVVLSECGNPDPYSKIRQEADQAVTDYLANSEIKKTLYELPPGVEQGQNLDDLRWMLDEIELLRLLKMSTWRRIWEGPTPSARELAEDFAAGPQIDALKHMLGPGSSKKILYLPDTCGGVIFDLAIIKSLLSQGHRVVMAFKEGFSFHVPTLWDFENSPSLRAAAKGAFFLHDEACSKNDLLRILREHHLLIISDGTREQLNLCRISVTFARAWKECDIVLAKGKRNGEVLLGSSHLFTRDIISAYRTVNGEFVLEIKEKASWAHKYSEDDLRAKADDIILAMQEAKRQGKAVMFYSAIIGSIPGQTKTAVKIVDVFTRHLRERLDNVFVLNPAEHFEPGMDGDDLMFMWEIVQRSGLLDIWRFQTVQDIEESFRLLGKKVPSIWSGKDSTYSTGCTKEMNIALDMQSKHSELQIIGPNPGNFFRRREYGIGKYFDVGIKI
jgi:uncharacterized protein with ATP-grasp and redox domains